MGFSFGNKTNKRSVDRFVLKINEMGNLSFGANDQFFKIVDMCFDLFDFQSFGIFGGVPKYFEELFQG